MRPPPRLKNMNKQYYKDIADSVHIKPEQGYNVVFAIMGTLAWIIFLGAIAMIGIISFY